VTAPLDLFLRIFRPFIFALNGIGNAVVRLIGLQPAGGHGAVHSVEELELLVHSTREAGLLEEEQERMVSGVFDFGDTVVRKLMTPRLDITAIEADASVEELIRLAADTGHSRLPVYEEDLDNIVGIVHVKDVLKGFTDAIPPASVRELMRPPYFVPENKRAGYLLSDFRRNKTQLAIVRDEYGTVVGVVTIEDLLEEIVGDIEDEYDVEEPIIRQVDENTCVIDGKMTLEDFNERMGVALPMEGADTLGGFVFGLVGHQPDQGEKAIWDSLEFQIEETDGRRVQKVRVSRLSPVEDASAEELYPPRGHESETASYDASSTSKGSRSE
jgi:CBS domain containing-hemolysin-like protein